MPSGNHMRRYKMITVALLILPSLIFMLTGCAGPRESVDFDPKFPMEKLMAFFVTQSPDANIDPLNSQRIHDAIVHTLQNKGYEYTSAETGANFIASYHVTIVKNVPSNFSIGFGLGSFGYHGGGGIGTSITPTINETEIRIDMFDPKTRRVFWSAGKVETLPKFESPETRARFFNTVVSQLLEKFPPRQTP